MPMSKKANTKKRKRQWQHVEESMKARGASPKVAAMAANAAVRKSFLKARRKGGRKR
jgi:hypothetical protein